MRHILEVQNKVQKSNSTSVQYVTLAKYKLDEEMPNHASLAQQNGFGPAFCRVC
jgi:hypothetical protein